MTSRNSARRHRGRHKPYPKRATPEPTAAPAVGPEAMSHWQQAIDKPLFVYFIQAEDGGPVKIGQANAPVKRLVELQCGNPRTLVIREVLLAAVDTERNLHTQWREAAIRGEWFGEGQEDEILRCAHEASAEQIEMHGTWGVHDIAERACYLVRQARESTGWVKA